MTAPITRTVQVELDGVRLDVLLAALDDAARYRRDRAEGYCLDCVCDPRKVCSEHARDLDTACDFDDLAFDLIAAPVTIGLDGAA
jgi:hypothetical protein